MKKCQHCKFLKSLFPPANQMQPREYWIYTEIFFYLHKSDVCNESEKN